MALSKDPTALDESSTFVSDENCSDSTETQNKFTSMVNEPQAAPKVPHGIVISGEASESDEEIDTNHTLPQSDSYFSLSESWMKNASEPTKKCDSREGSSAEYNSLLHKKLREKNQNLRKNMIELVTQPYESATKEIHNISQQLIKSQLLVQELRTTIRRLTNDLFDMEDKMEALRTGSFLPEMYGIPPSSESS